MANPAPTDIEAGAVKVPEVTPNPATIKGEYALAFQFAPANVGLPEGLLSPLNPEITAPEFIVKFEVITKLPVPVIVPLRTVLFIIGLFPIGNVQLLFIVFALEVWASTTRLKVTLLQLSVAVDPSRVKVPLLWLKIGDPEIVKAPAKNMFPDGALNVPPEIVKAPFKSAPDGRDKVPELRVTVLATEKVVYVEKSAVAPEIVKNPVPDPLYPVKPENDPPAFKVIVGVPPPTALEIKIVPLPVIVLEVNVVVPLIVGLFPTGSIQLVKVFPPEFERLTLLKVTFPQFTVAPPIGKVIVPLLWLKVPPVIPTPPGMAIVPLEALKVPPVIVKAETVAPFGTLIEPELI